MRQYNEAEEQERLAFAREAAKAFAKHPGYQTFGPLKPGSYMAIRFGLGDDCVLVVRLHDYEEVVNYTQSIPREAAQKTKLYHEAGKKALETVCTDEGCPHFGTLHGHPTRPDK